MKKITVRAGLEEQVQGFHIYETISVCSVPRVGELIDLENCLMRVEDVWHQWENGQYKIIVWVIGS